MAKDEYEKLEDLTQKAGNTFLSSYEKSIKLVNRITANLLAILYFILIWSTITLFAAPILINSEDNLLLGAGALAYNLVHLLLVCHQMPQRSLAIFSTFLPVCARDVGMLLGFHFSVLLSLLHRAPRIFSRKRFLILGLTPILIDGLGQSVYNLWESTNTIRVLTGFLFGFIITGFIASWLLKKYHEYLPTPLGLTKVSSFIIISSLIFTSVLTSIAPGIGEGYLSRQDVERMTGSRIIVYIAPRAITSVSYDPFINNHEDPVLEDIPNIRFIDSVGGVWLAVKPEEVTQIGELYKTPGGDYYYINALTKKNVYNTTH